MFVLKSRRKEKRSTSGAFTRLMRRERDGYIKQDLRYEWACIFMSPPPRLCLPLSALDPNHILRAHIILGFTRDGMHLLSYSHVIPFGYTLFIWRFGRPPTLLLTVPLFRNELYSSLTQHLQQSVFVPTESEWFSNSINYHPQMLIRIVHSPELPVNLNNTLPYKVTISLLIAHAQPLGEPLSRDDSSTNVCHYVTVIPWILEEKVQTLRTPTQCIHMTYEASCDEHWEPEIMFQYPILLLSRLSSCGCVHVFRQGVRSLYFHCKSSSVSTNAFAIATLMPNALYGTRNFSPRVYANIGHSQHPTNYRLLQRP
jgi:hypothetical protein